MDIASKTKYEAVHAQVANPKHAHAIVQVARAAPVAQALVQGLQAVVRGEIMAHVEIMARVLIPRGLTAADCIAVAVQQGLI